MIDLTPLDVRKKRGDFRKAMRGYDVQEVDTFLEIVADRLEDLVKEVMMLRERSAILQAQVDAQGGREKAVQDALVTAQSLRDQINDQARREADMARREAELEARRIIADAERMVEERQGALEELERKRARFLKALRRLLERELDVVAVEEGRAPLEDTAVDLDLSGGRRADQPARSGPPGGEDGGARGSGGSIRGELWLGLGEDPPIPDPDEELAG